MPPSIRDWSLITGRGGATKQEAEGNVNFYPYEKKGGGAEKVLAMLKGGGGHKTFWGSFYAVAWSFSHIEGGSIKFPLFKRGGAKRFTLSRGGGAQKVSDPHFPIL